MAHSHAPQGGGAAGAAVCCPPGGLASQERLRYFARQLLTPDDLTQEQAYLRAKLRRHNRLLHGWGVVCGLRVKGAAGDWTVTVESGYALGPQGDEIVVDEQVTVDLSRQGLDGNALTSCDDPTDPWCSSVRVERKAGDVVYLALAYDECPSRPVRVQPAGCGCDGGQCEYSRTRESFAVRVLDQLPASHLPADPPSGYFACPSTGVRTCPACQDEPWVVLARLTLQSKTVGDGQIDNHAVRRYVASFGDWWFRCAGPAPSPAPPSPTGIPVLPVGPTPPPP